MKPKLSEILAAIKTGGVGFCLRCGEEVQVIRPDAYRKECENCGHRAIYGAEELLVRGHYED
jgi:hypothetical protein